jgi:AraC-like DNA-binding protein
MPPGTHARLHLPSAALAGCMHLAVERDTRGLQLTDAQRFNFYPASPLPTISWIFEGEVRMVDDRGPPHAPALGDPLPRVVFSGPYRRPVASWSPGPVHALTVGFYPEALSRLWGIRIEEHLDTILPLCCVLSGAGLETLLGVDAAAASPPLQQVAAALEPLWAEAKVNAGGKDLRSWLRSVALRAAFTKTGAGVRQVQRRIRDWTGQSQRELQRFARAEEAFALSANGWVDAQGLAVVAAQAGYSDQSHLGREIRRMTGLSPARLAERVKCDESFWMYRLLGEHLLDESIHLPG